MQNVVHKKISVAYSFKSGQINLCYRNSKKNNVKIFFAYSSYQVLVHLEIYIVSLLLKKIRKA